MNAKVSIPYEHRSDDLALIELALSESGTPGEDAWHPALRDTVDGQRVVWARFPARGRQATVWVRDSTGARPVTSIKV